MTSAKNKFVQGISAPWEIPQQKRERKEQKQLSAMFSNPERTKLSAQNDKDPHNLTRTSATKCNNHLWCSAICPTNSATTENYLRSSVYTVFSFFAPKRENKQRKKDTHSAYISKRNLTSLRWCRAHSSWSAWCKIHHSRLNQVNQFIRINRINSSYFRSWTSATTTFSKMNVSAL